MTEIKRQGRPPKTAADIERERARIASIASDLFQNEGVEAISMRRLAKEAGVTPKTLYAYFAAKRDILQHIWATFFVELFDQIDLIAKSRRTPSARLRAACLRYIDYWVSQPDRYRMVFMADGVSQTDVSIFLDASSILHRYTIFADLLTPAGSNPSGSQTARLNSLVCFLNGIAHNKVTISNYEWGTPEALLDTVLPGIIAS